MDPFFVRALVGALCVAGPACAQSQAGATLAPVIVTGNPLGATDLVTPAASLSGTGLALRSQGSLGETLNGLPGVSSTYFGPVASRPVIRGLDGDRVRVLANGSTLGDVSGLSYDHGVAADAIAVERIEVLRGPAALLYGGTAIGGVVNVIDNRIPRDRIEAMAAKLDAGHVPGNREGSAAALLEGGTGRMAWHGDLFRRSSGDVRVPVQLPCTNGAAAWVANRICNSSARAEGASVGGSVFFDHGYAGLSAGTFSNRYGSVAEDEVTLAMRSRRLAFEGEWRRLSGWFERIKVQASRNDYTHTEFEAAVAGTRFAQAGNDLRVEAGHRAWHSLRGVWGLQADGSRFSASGTEAFTPSSRTRQSAVFAYEELGVPWGRLDFGARVERVDVRSFADPMVPRFGAAMRGFSPASASAGALWNVLPDWQLTANLARSERAPRDYELFADGPHLATGAYEVGRPGLGVERSTSFELGARWKRGPHRFELNAWRTRFRDYIFLARTGAAREQEDGETLPEFAYTAANAAFRGAEANGRIRLLEGSHEVDAGLRADLVRAHRLDTGEPLPRIAPLRVGVEVEWKHCAWGARLGAERHARQVRVPLGELATPGYTLVTAAVTYRLTAPPGSLLAYLRVGNAGDRLAYSASSILTQSQPGRVPLPGRSVKLGLQATF
ncbi:MAG: TonB-dependent receptor [Burkholderiales bacterium]|nr:TonB-dependent receptor [Burkholderiales bacterium]